jgi:hypothetical protein
MESWEPPKKRVVFFGSVSLITDPDPNWYQNNTNLEYSFVLRQNLVTALPTFMDGLLVATQRAARLSHILALLTLVQQPLVLSLNVGAQQLFWWRGIAAQVTHNGVILLWRLGKGVVLSALTFLPPVIIASSSWVVFHVVEGMNGTNMSLQPR